MKNSCTSMLSRRTLLTGAAALTAAPLLARASNTRGKAIRIVVPFPAGGGTDVMGRLIALELGRELNATVIVDNVPGATGTLGSAQVARSAPDGFTLLLGISATHAIAPALFKDLKYSPERDFVALARIAHGGNVLVANAKYAADTLPEMLALVKRSSALPQVPTLVESGVAFDTEIWFSLFAPAKLPPAEVQRLAQASARALQKPHVVERIKSLGLEADPISREGFVKQWHEDTAIWARLVKSSGVTVN